MTTPLSWDADSLVDRYGEVRAHTETLAAPLSPEDQTVQSMPDVSPTKWHRAHVTWFFETFVLAEHEPGFAPFQDRYWFLFNSYYEAVGPRFSRPDRGVISRPGAHDVGVYRANVDDRMRDLSRPLDERHARQAGRRPSSSASTTSSSTRSCCSWTSSTCSRSTPCSRCTPAPRARPCTTRRARLGRRRGRAGRDRPRGRRVLLRQRAAPPPAVARALPARRPARHQRRVAGVHGRRRLPPRTSSGSPTAGRKVNADGWRAPFYWIGARRRLVRAHAQRHLAGQPRAPGEPRQLLRGRGLRHLGRQAAAHRGRVGARRRCDGRADGRRDRVGQPRRHHDVPPPAGRARRPGRLAPGLRRLLGVDLLGLPPLPRLPPGRGRASASTTASSCRNQMVLRGGCALTPPGHARATYRNFFPPRLAMGALRRAPRRRRRAAMTDSGVRSGLGRSSTPTGRRAALVERRPPRARLPAPQPAAQVAVRRRGLAALRRDHPAGRSTTRPRRERTILRRTPPTSRPPATPPRSSSSAAAPATRPACCSTRSPAPAGSRASCRSTSRRGRCATPPSSWRRGTPASGRGARRRLHPPPRPPAARRPPAGRVPRRHHRQPVRRGARAPSSGRSPTRCEPGDWLLLGTDLVKSADRLIAAYDDPQGVTEAFVTNCLRVLNRELGADFDLDAFSYVPFWDPHDGADGPAAARGDAAAA